MGRDADDYLKCDKMAEIAQGNRGQLWPKQSRKEVIIGETDLACRSMRKQCNCDLQGSLLPRLTHIWPWVFYSNLSKLQNISLFSDDVFLQERLTGFREGSALAFESCR